MAEKNSAQTYKQTDRHYKNNGHLEVNQFSRQAERRTNSKHHTVARITKETRQWYLCL